MSPGTLAPLGRMLEWATVVVFACGLAAFVLPGTAATVAGGAAVAAVGATPLVRVAWLAGRWWRRHDRLFAVAAAGVLVVVATGAALGLLT